MAVQIVHPNNMPSKYKWSFTVMLKWRREIQYGPLKGYYSVTAKRPTTNCSKGGWHAAKYETFQSALQAADHFNTNGPGNQRCWTDGEFLGAYVEHLYYIPEDGGPKGPWGNRHHYVENTLGDVYRIRNEMGLSFAVK